MRQPVPGMDHAVDTRLRDLLPGIKAFLQLQPPIFPPARTMEPRTAGKVEMQTVEKQLFESCRMLVSAGPHTVETVHLLGPGSLDKLGNARFRNPGNFRQF